MEKKVYITASEHADLLGILVSHAYRLIHDKNKELANDGYLTVYGRVPTRYFEKRGYSGNELRMYDITVVNLFALLLSYFLDIPCYTKFF